MPITIELSGDVQSDMTAAGLDPAQEAQRLEDEINGALHRLGKTDEDASALDGSGQTIRIVCFGSAEADRNGLPLPPGFPLGPGGDDPAATAGDFDSSGKPKAKGTAVIAIECDRFKRKWSGWGWFRLIAHELLHASNEKHKHPPEGIGIYEDWVRKMVLALPAEIIKWIVIEDLWRETAEELRERAKRRREKAKKDPPLKKKENEEGAVEDDARALVDEKSADEARAARRAARSREAAGGADDQMRAIERAKEMATPEEQSGLDALLKKAEEEARRAHEEQEKAEADLDKATKSREKASEALDGS